MYYVNKVAGWALSPLGLFFIGLCAGWALRRARLGCLRLLGAVSAFAAVAFLWAASLGVTTRLVGVALERPWERDGRMHGSVEGLPDADAIVVLGGGTGTHGKCNAPELFAGADRVWQGARLYREKSPARPGMKVFCTGGGSACASAALLEDLGVPREAMMFCEDPRNTEEEAALVKARLGADAPRVFLVTSAWHMSRAKLLFERAGLEVVPVPADFEMSFVGENDLEPGDFFPSADALNRNSYAVKEWVAGLAYRLLGR